MCRTSSGLTKDVVEKATKVWESFEEAKDDKSAVKYYELFDTEPHGLPWWLSTPGAYEDLAPVLHKQLVP